MRSSGNGLPEIAAGTAHGLFAAYTDILCAFRLSRHVKPSSHVDRSPFALSLTYEFHKAQRDIELISPIVNCAHAQVHTW